MKNLLLLWAVIVVLLCAPEKAASQEGLCGNFFLNDVTKKMQGVKSLYATFTQRNRMVFMETPLVSKGRVYISVAAPENPYVYWEYWSPIASGFIFRDGKAYLWTQDKKFLRPIDDQEAVMVKMITRHILAMYERPENLKKMYRVECIENTTPSLRLYPREKNTFFEHLDLQFSSDLRAIKSLYFREGSGEGTYISLENIRLNTLVPPDVLP